MIIERVADILKDNGVEDSVADTAAASIVSSLGIDYEYSIVLPGGVRGGVVKDVAQWSDIPDEYKTDVERRIVTDWAAYSV